uniref:THAP-type domain-containing protein n=1 Tax=Anopheles christyi TaxID=43041 RepID=A0A182JPY9_9DIPT
MPFSCCSASFCKNNRYNVNRRGLDITFHTFPPLNYQNVKQWIEFCKREADWIPNKHSVLCSAHFRDDDFQMNNCPIIKQGKRLRHLKVFAVPSIVGRPPITLSKRQKLDEVRKKLLSNLYNKDDENNPGTENDHTYSEAKTGETEQKDPLIGCKKSIYFLQRYPNVCALCLRIMDDDNMCMPVTHFHDSLECTIEQKLDEITGDPMNQEDRSDVQHLLPDKVCEGCLDTLIKYHQYQRQLDCMKKFSTGIAHLLYGNPKPLENLYQDQGAYLVDVLRNLDTAQSTQIKQSLEQVLEEVTSYGQDKHNLPMYADGPADPRSFDQSSSTDDALSDYEETGTGVAVSNRSQISSHSSQPSERVLEIYEVPHGNSRKRLAEKNTAKQLHICPYSNICKKWFLEEAAVQQHIREEHKSFDCHICGSKIAFYDLYQKHMESHTIARALLMSHNRKRAISETFSSMLSDESRPDPKSAGNYVCGTCLGVFVDDKEFSSHRCSLPSTKLATPKDILITNRNRNFVIQPENVQGAISRSKRVTSKTFFPPVADCSYNRRNVKKQKLDIVFHTFPVDIVQRHKWVKFCQRGPGWKPKSCDAVCSVHFKEDDYQMAKSPLMTIPNNLRRLKIGVVPTIWEGSGIPLATRIKLEKEVREKLEQELYNKNNETEIDIDAIIDVKYGTKSNVSSVLNKVVYRLNSFPNICAFCYKAITDESVFLPFNLLHEELQCTVGQKFDEITGETINQAERLTLNHLLPDKVCEECLDIMITFHQYQRQLQCLRKFSTGLARLLKGNRKPLQTLYEEQGSYLVRVLKNLNVCPGPEENVTLERLEAEVVSYGRIKKYTMFVPKPPSKVIPVTRDEPVQIAKHDSGQFNESFEEPEMDMLQDDIDTLEAITVSPIQVFPTHSSVSLPTVQKHDAPQTEKRPRGRPRNEESGEIRIWICPYVAVCKEQFIDEPSFQEHMANRHKYFNCNACGTKIKFYELYIKHIESHAIARALLLSHNRKGSNKDLKCKSCGKVFQSENILRRHETTHAGERNFVCGTCLGVFLTNEEFGKHKCPSVEMVVESSEDPFTDDVCVEPAPKKPNHTPDAGDDSTRQPNEHRNVNDEMVTEVEYLEEELLEDVTEDTCAVASCTYNREKVKTLKLDIMFHKFPTDWELRQKWHEFCRQGTNWKPPKHGLVCSIHFTKDDYQMSRSPLLQENRLYRMLKVNAVPSVRYGVPVPVDTSRAIEEATRKQLYEQLYNNNSQNTEVMFEVLDGNVKKRVPNYVYRLHQFPNLCAFCFTPFTEKKQFSPFTQYHSELCCTIGQKFDEITEASTDKEERAALQHLLPDKICAECLESLVTFHQYQRQLKCLRKFSTGMAHLRKGNRKPLQKLYTSQGDYLSTVLKNLNIGIETEKVLNIFPEVDKNVTLAMEVQEQPPRAAYYMPRQHTSVSSNYEQMVETVDDYAELEEMSTIPSNTTITLQKRVRGRARKREPDGSYKETWYCPFADVCNKWFSDKPSLNQHIVSRHKYFKCDTCGLKVKFYDVYKKHIESHAVARALLLCHSKKLKCGICWKIFQRQAKFAELLERHKKTHTIVGSRVIVNLPASSKGGGHKHLEDGSAFMDDLTCNVDPLSSSEVTGKETLTNIDHDYTRGKDWTPFKTDAICSVHFRDDDYQMAHSPLVKWSKNLRRLHVNAYPSVQDGSVVTVSKKQKLEEQARQQRLEELYRQNNPLAEPSTEFDHTYSGVTVKEEPDESPVLEKIVYRLQEFPNLCALCFRAIDDEKLFAPFVSYSESLESTIEQKYDEITGEVINQKEHASIHHLLPDKVCAECLEVLIQFHHYQRQLQCLKKFSAGMAQLLKGDRQPLAELYATQGDYLVNILKNLNICNESEDNVTLERLEAEVATYGRVKKCIVFEQDHPSDTSAVVHQCEEVGPNTSVAIIPASSFRIDSSIASSGETNQLIRTHTKDGDVTSKSKKWICPYDEICREWFLDEPSLQQHMNNDHKIFKCRTCGYKVKFYDLFKKHIQSHDIARALLLSHNNTGSNKQRKCEKCGRLFRSLGMSQNWKKN